MNMTTNRINPAPQQPSTPRDAQGAAADSAPREEVCEVTADDEELPCFDDLQPLFDAESRRLAALARRPEAQVRSLNLAGASTFRSRLAATLRLLVVINIAAAVCALVILLPDPAISIRLAAFVLAATYAGVAFHCIRTLRSSLGNPRRPLATALTSARQAAVVSTAAMIVMVSVSCLPIGDGYTMSETAYTARTATITGLNEIISQL